MPRPEAAREAGAGDLFDLCRAQEGLWMAQALDPLNPLFNTGQYIELTGPLDVSAFRAAHATTMAEADALRLEFTTRDGRPMQRLGGQVPRLQHVDVSDSADPMAAARAAMARDSGRPTDPARDPMAAFILFRLSPTHHLWYERIHHLAIDGYGMVLITNRVASLYSAAVAGSAAGPALAPFAQATQEDAAYATGDACRQDAAFWQQHLADIGTIASPSGREPETGHSFLRREAAVPAATFASLQERAKALRVGWPDLLGVISAAYLRRVAPEGDAIYGMPFMARFGSGAARVPCMWMNVLPYRFDLDEEEPLDAAFTRAAATLAQMRRAGRYRSEQLRRDLGRTQADQRIYGPLINIQPYDIAPKFAGLQAGLHILSAGPVDDLTISFRGDGAQALTLEIDANASLYDGATVTAHRDRLLEFTARALAADRLADVPTVTQAEHQSLIFDMNATDHPLPDSTLTELIEAQMRAAPQAIAVEDGHQTLSYAQFDHRTRALAEALVQRGAGRGTLVAVALERSVDLAVALVAILRAGAAYVPLDPAQPAARLATLIGRTRPVALLGAQDLDVGGAILPFAPPDWPDQPTGAILPQARGDDLAYVLFTSGSTGEPKGVMIEHRAIVNRLLWMRDHYDFTAADRILQKTPTTFDVSVWELFLPYLCGGTLVMAPPEAHRDPRQIAELITQARISVLHFVPSMLAAFLAVPASAGIALRAVFCSGEALPAAHRDRFHQRIRAQLHNLYGPTEAAVDVSCWAADAEDRSAPLPIGHPVWNTRLYVLDSALRPVPVGVAGALYLGGVQLARGYLGRDDLTAQRFLPDPFRAGARIYDTGDLAMRRADGAVIYLGRSDDQVKIRGMRVELGEIEHVMRQSALLREAAVIAAPDGAGHIRLVGYLVPAAGYDAGAFRAWLAQQLPQHMVPAALVEMDDFPTTANGKLDRKALPAPPVAAGSAHQGGTRGDAAHTATEGMLAAAFAQVLNLPEPPRTGCDFFASGGDSLSALRLLLTIEEATGRAIPLGLLFEQPTIAGLARALDAEGTASAGLAPLLPLEQRTDRGGPAHDAAPLFLLHPAGGLAWGYRGLARALYTLRARDIFGLQSPVLSGADMPRDLTSLCAHYADLILSASDSPRIHLAGWSLGGLLAQELAVTLRARGREVGLVGLLDAYPADVWRAEPQPDPAAALRALLAIAGLDPDAHPELDSRAKIVRFLKGRGSLMGALPADVLDAVVRLVTGTNQLMRGHHHRRYDGRITHIRAALDHAGRGFAPDLWAPYCTQVEALNIQCFHKDMIAPAQVDEIAAHLVRAMDGP